MITDTAAQVSEIAATMRLFVAPKGTGEIRVIGCGATFGIFFRHEDILKAAALAAKYSQTAKGCYLVMNPIAPALAERPQLVKTCTLTTDADIVRRIMLLIDFDPSSAERGSNDSATDAEKEAARERMDEVFEWLRDHRRVPTRLLECDRALSVGDPESENLLVEGDNLEALKALLPRYRGQVKCIYIDPPYKVRIADLLAVSLITIGS